MFLNTYNIVLNEFITLKDSLSTKIIGAGLNDITIKLWGYRFLPILIILSVWMAIRAFKQGKTLTDYELSKKDKYQAVKQALNVGKDIKDKGFKNVVKGAVKDKYSDVVDWLKDTSPAELVGAAGNLFGRFGDRLD